MKNININKAFFILSLLNISLFFFSCQKDKISERDYPRVDIHGVTQNESGVLFKGEILSKGTLEITERGFVWSSTNIPTINSSKISVPGSYNIGLFEANSQIDFVKDTTYTAKAYLKTNGRTIYSKEIVFESTYNSPAPNILGFEPKQAKWNDTLYIWGEYFSFFSQNANVFLGEIETQIISISDTSIYIKIPEEENNSFVPVIVKIHENTSSSEENFQYINPIISDYYPKNGTFSDTLTITGEDFPDYKSYCYVKIGGHNAQIIENNQTIIKVIVPLEVNTPESNVEVYVSGVSKTFDDKFVLDPPIITNISPKIVNNTNEKITLSGENFNPKSEYNIVKFGDYTAIIEQSSSNELQVRIPENIINDTEVSVFDTLSVKITVAEQSFTSNDSIFFYYFSRWTLKNSLPSLPRAFAVSYSINEKGYYGLGTDYVYSNYTHFNDFWEYNPLTETWTEKAPFPSNARGWTSSFVIDNKIYFFCGITGGTCLNEVWVYNTDTNTWTQKNDFPGESRYRAFCFSINGKGYLGAGKDENWVTLNDFWEYNPNTDSWTQKNNIQHLIPGWGIIIETITVNNTAYVFGKTDASSDSRDFWKYNATSDTWEQLADMPGEYSELTVFSLQNEIFVATGISHQVSGSRILFKYNQSDTWESIGWFKGHERRAACSFSLNNKGYIFGGFSYLTYTNDMWQFDPTK